MLVLGIFAKIVSLSTDKKKKIQNPITISPETRHNDETYTNFHETLSKADLQFKENINIPQEHEIKTKRIFEFKPKIKETSNTRQTSQDKTDIGIDINPWMETEIIHRKLSRKQTSESSNQSKQSDSISSVIPVITISTTESDEEIRQHSKADDIIRSLESNNMTKEKIEIKKHDQRDSLKRIKCSSDLKSLQRQSSVDSINDNKPMKATSGKNDEEGGHKYQYSL